MCNTLNAARNWQVPEKVHKHGHLQLKVGSEHLFHNQNNRYHLPLSSVIHTTITMGPPNGAEHSKARPVLMRIIKKGGTARGTEDEAPRLVQGRPMGTNAPNTNASEYMCGMLWCKALTYSRTRRLGRCAFVDKDQDVLGRTSA